MYTKILILVYIKVKMMLTNGKIYHVLRVEEGMLKVVDDENGTLKKIVV